MDLKRSKINLLTEKNIGSEIKISGWVRTKRQSKNVSFISVNDGSSIISLQVVVDMNSFDISLVDNITTGASISVSGKLEKSEGKIQSFELLASDIKILGLADP